VEKEDNFAVTFRSLCHRHLFRFACSDKDEKREQRHFANLLFANPYLILPLSDRRLKLFEQKVRKQKTRRVKTLSLESMSFRLTSALIKSSLIHLFPVLCALDASLTVLFCPVFSYVKSSFQFIDPDKIAVWGKGFGGYLVTALMERDPTFNCGIAVAPIVNWKNYSK
jgi:hypothetical protein